MERLDAVLPYIEQNKCALFIGAGLSKIAGCYDWESVVKEMLSHLIFQENNIRPEDLIGKMGLEKVMTYCHKIFINNDKEKEYWGIARKAIMWHPKLYQEKYLPLIKILKSINPFPQIITTNIDDCLEYTREFNLSEIYFKSEHFIGSNLDDSGIFHIHGYVEEFNQSLLTREQYITRYQEQEFQSFLMSLFSKYSVIFIGYSLRDQELQDIMLKTNTKDKNHFLLVPEEDNLDSSTMTVLKELYGIVSIVYGRRDKFHIVLEDWITKNFKIVKLGGENLEIPNV